MPVEIRVPSLGESITEVLVGQWRKREGDQVAKDENLVEIESDKATVEVPAPIAGHVAKVLKGQGETATVGEVIGYLEAVAAGAVGDTPAPAHVGAEPTPAAHREANGVRSAERPQPAVSAPGAIMPAARRAMAEAGLRADEVTATGPGGRLLKEDVLRKVESAAAPTPRAAAPSTPAPAPSAPVATASSAPRGPREEEIVPMTPIRRRIAQRLVEAQKSAALLTTFNEIDMSAVVQLRQDYRDVFQQRYGVKLGFMSFFVKAAIEALKLYPQVGAEIRGTDIVYRNYHDIGIAVSGGKGLVVPVLRSAERMSFAEIELAVEDYGRLARENKLKLDQLEGGTFTISNGGVFGSLLSTPIVNPPQSGILGLHAIQERPVARDGNVVIRPMMYVALTYDHRIVDGREAVTFLRRIKEVVEQPARMLLEV